ncbi:hypothetical protein AAFF_G00008700 [Aldrovandia affinis]|uniref:Uncharacterized protein n=1 Tax=Aldrovandia affinis TaxID=143900 RepID=A0AAD7T6A8_9TELE|nr:hypothetical protein AAFF_G00008700 [Aldrovandia affinis]
MDLTLLKVLVEHEDPIIKEAGTKAMRSREPSLRVLVIARDIIAKDLLDFFTSTTKRIFHHLQIDAAFLSMPPAAWITSDGYNLGKEWIGKLLVTNDIAERGVVLIHELQYMIQVAEDHRQVYSKTANKKDLLC